ncbi:MAG: hypothetical protein ACXAC7_01545 [Candidatus Hodarchaeales archaeon]|jgi:hypothetical protein
MTNNNHRVIVKNVTIRGIESKTYEDFSYYMKVLGMTLGEAVTKMMTEVMKNYDGTFPDLSAKAFKGKEPLKKANISHHNILSVSEHDLIDANARLSFSHISLLELEADITVKSFNRFIRSISHCDKVRIPNIFPKLLVFSKLEGCDEIEIYDQKTGEVLETTQTTRSRRSRRRSRLPRPPKPPKAPKAPKAPKGLKIVRSIKREEEEETRMEEEEARMEEEQERIEEEQERIEEEQERIEEEREEMEEE